MKSILGMSAATLLPGIVAAALLGAPVRADVVTEWNKTTGALVANDVGNNPRLRTLAMPRLGCNACPRLCRIKGQIARSANKSFIYDSPYRRKGGKLAQSRRLPVSIQAEG